MRAVGYRKAGSVIGDGALIDVDVPQPHYGPRDVLVHVKAISVNPVDTKIRSSVQPADGTYGILGWDMAGIVVAVGDDVTRFSVGDEVFAAGDVQRPGSYAHYCAVDERIVGHKPKSLNWSEAAAMPLTAITAWEGLFDRLALSRHDDGVLLVIGGAGGVGSMVIQLAKRLTALRVVATASRDETRQWAKRMGADDVIDHTQPLSEEWARLGLEAPRYIYSTTQTDRHFSEITKVIAPQGHLVLIDDPESVDIMPLKRKAVAVHWEFMFARPMFETADMDQQGKLLERVAALVDHGELVTTGHTSLGIISAETLTKAHQVLESGHAIGKMTLEGFGG